jgi:hypothetical protein
VQVAVMVTVAPITEHHLNSTFALRVANSEGETFYRRALQRDFHLLI